MSDSVWLRSHADDAPRQRAFDLRLSLERVDDKRRSTMLHAASRVIANDLSLPGAVA